MSELCEYARKLGISRDARDPVTVFMLADVAEALSADLRSLEQRLSTQQPAPQERSSEAETIPSHVVTLVKRALERDPDGLLKALEGVVKG